MVAPIDITFLGTGSAQPSHTRNHQSMAFRADGEIWLFDAGEATQHQLQKSNLKMGRITKVFITHMHGDHCFGLPPLLCTMTENLNPNRAHEGVVDVYGPRPLRQWLRVALRSTYSRLGRHYRVHELIMEGEVADENQEDRHPDEEPGTNIHVKDNTFDLPIDDKEGWTVRAAPIQHSIPSLGYVIQEPSQPGKLDHATIVPKIQRNAQALLEKGYKSPMAVLGKLQRTQVDITLPDGEVLTPPARRPGRQIVILGDTCDASSMLPLCNSPHLLVHEATNALTQLDRIPTSSSQPEITLKDVEDRARSHGHSTPQMAADLAKRMGAQKLIMTHFSARYKGDDSDEESVAIMEEIRQHALDVLGKERDKDVFCARDLWFYEIKY
ncbi:beta-lactamase-like protein [Zychaea mexicana]|uniref:beta-lactamase-like protein n=1 Tax=Zychaea mexicana TaxID=64656 RepID=UPI0022FE2465|nr:beta-lactamase-like protein [Zychaea mexicana]KAI9494757.1 beta-lactamase-like protein [Zychaea mexicana]